MQESGTEYDYNGLNDRLTWGFYGASDVGLNAAHIYLHARAEGSTNTIFGLPGEVYQVELPPSSLIDIPIRVVRAPDPNGGPGYRIVVDAGTDPTLVQDGNVTLGIDVDVSYVGDTRATVDVIFAAQYDDDGNGITGLNAGPVGAEWSNQAELKHARRASWDVAAVVIPR